MSRRWSPPGRGWIRTADSGRLAIWMKPTLNGVSIALYTGDGFGYTPDIAEVWVINVPRGSWLPYTIMDKPHRIYWANEPHVGTDVHIPHEYRVMSIWSKFIAPCHRGHRRLNRNRRIWKHPLPSKIIAAFGETSDRFSYHGLLTTVSYARNLGANNE